MGMSKEEGIMSDEEMTRRIKEFLKHFGT